MSICCIVLNYRDERQTINCLDALQQEPITKIIVLDNSADEGSQSRLQDAVASYAKTTDALNIDLIISDSNLGFSKGVNTAFKEMEKSGGYEFYLLINNDAIPEPGLVETLTSAFAENQRLVIAAPCINDGNTTQGYRYYQPWTGLQSTRKIAGGFAYISGCCLMLKKDCFGSSVLDEDFFMYGEDIELSWRVCISGGQITICDNACVYHKGTASSKRCGLFYEYHVVRGHFLLCDKLSNSAIAKYVAYGIKTIVMTLRSLVRTLRCRKPAPLIAMLLQVKKNAVLYPDSK